MNFKRILALMTMLVVLVLAACGGGSKSDNNDDGEADSGSSGESVVIRLSHNQPIESPEHAGAEKFKEVIEEKSEGNVTVEIYPASQLGSLREQIEGTQMGEIDITMQPTAFVTPFVDDVKVIDLPYLWPADTEQTYEVLDSDAGQAVLDTLEAGGFKGLGFWPGGFKLFTTGKTEIHSPEDFKGLDIRVMSSPLLEDQYRLWGANPTMIEYAEVYNSLQQGVVDGHENPLQSIYLNNYQEVQDNVIESYHGIMSYLFMANKAWYDGLSEDVQEMIMEAEEAGKTEARQVLAETEDEYRQSIIDSGVNYYELTDDEIEKFREVSVPFQEEAYGTPEQLEILKKIKDKIEEVSK
ncbi:TRAP transporter substrate-binding protein [Pseudogracilibacillus sp. SE30717A]|uniref:TRAP transporter substrate-binding protein n=1 Tax=Pseudogracilibacillus sp. SE30717A TaxID=3098293 RepID=UPI00300DFC36